VVVTSERGGRENKVRRKGGSTGWLKAHQCNISKCGRCGSNCNLTPKRNQFVTGPPLTDYISPPIVLLPEVYIWHRPSRRAAKSPLLGPSVDREIVQTPVQHLCLQRKERQLLLGKALAVNHQVEGEGMKLRLQDVVCGFVIITPADLDSVKL
jgi:hypothetical protein